MFVGRISALPRERRSRLIPYVDDYYTKGLAVEGLSAGSPLPLKLVLNFCSFLHEVKGDTQKAVSVANEMPENVAENDSHVNGDMNEARALLGILREKVLIYNELV